MILRYEVFDDPDAAGPAEAIAAIDAGRARATPARISAFANTLTATYPDAAMMEAAGNDKRKCVWARNPAERTEDGIHVLEVDSMRFSGNLLDTIVHNAADHGLLVLDRHVPILYRARQAVFINGVAKAVDPPLPPEQAPPFEAPFDNDEATRRLVELLARREAIHGFSPFFDNEVRMNWCVWRDRGEVGQAITARPEWEREMGAFSVLVRFHFGLGTVWQALERWMPRWSAAVARNRRTVGPAFQVFVDDPIQFVPQASKAAWREAGRRVAPDALEAWSATFGAWLDGEALPRLDAADDLEGFRALMLSDYRRGRIQEGHWGASEVVATAVLLKLPGATSAEQASWWPVVEKQAATCSFYPLKRPPGDHERELAEEMLAAVARLRDASEIA